MSGEKVIEKAGPGGPEVKVAGRAGCKTYANCHSYIFSTKTPKRHFYNRDTKANQLEVSKLAGSNFEN
jgi:hypothetical protein